jgi:hypothetical protein
MAASDYSKTEHEEIDLNLTSVVKFDCDGYAGGSFQVSLLDGAWSAAAVTVEGSNDGVEFHAFSTPITFSADGIAEVASPTLLRKVVRFRVSTVNGAAGRALVTAHFREI